MLAEAITILNMVRLLHEQNSESVYACKSELRHSPLTLLDMGPIAIIKVNHNEKKPD